MSKHRSGRHVKPRITVVVPPEDYTAVVLAADEEGLSLSEYTLEALRAYMILGKRDKLSDADWRRVVSG